MYPPLCTLKLLYCRNSFFLSGSSQVQNWPVLRIMSPLSTSPNAYKRINSSKLYYLGFKETLFNVREVSESESHSVVSNSLQHHGLYSPRNSPGQNTGVGSLSLLQGIFPTQGLKPGLLHCRQIVYQWATRHVQC